MDQKDDDKTELKSTSHWTTTAFPAIITRRSTFYLGIFSSLRSPTNRVVASACTNFHTPGYNNTCNSGSERCSPCQSAYSFHIRSLHLGVWTLQGALERHTVVTVMNADSSSSPENGPVYGLDDPNSSPQRFDWLWDPSGLVVSGYQGKSG
jgi:hypothetical protein